jgi:hypothetical protein
MPEQALDAGATRRNLASFALTEQDAQYKAVNDTTME